MSLRHEGQALPLEKSALAQRLPAAAGKPLVLVHGLCYTPVYLHYNSGLHTSVNGRQLAGLLEWLLAAWQQPKKQKINK